MTMYPRVLEWAVGDMRPVLRVPVFNPDQRTVFLGTGLLTATFTLVNLDTGAIKVNAQAATITATSPQLIFTYTWQSSDLNTAGRYSASFKGYWGASNTVPQEFVGPEIIVKAAGQRLSY